MGNSIGNPERAKAAAWLVLNSLNPDLEEAERALQFQDFLRSALGSNECRRTVVAIYELAASGEWNVSSLHDQNMICYSLTEALNLVPAVREHMETLINRMPNGPHVRSAWNYVLQKFAENQNPVALKRPA